MQNHGTKPNRQRDALVHAMGFTDWDSYIRSPFWKAIRGSVIRGGRKCRLCGEDRGKHILILDYSENVLRGKDLSKLILLCFTCNNVVRFSAAGDLVGINQARKMFAKLKGTQQAARRMGHRPGENKLRPKPRRERGRPICRRCVQAPAVRRCGNLCIPCHDYVQSQSTDWNNA